MKTIQINAKNKVVSKVVCIGRNYVEHIQELNNEVPSEPVIFIKPNSAISTQLKSDDAEPIHYEAEICFVIVNNKISAVGCGLDLTKRAIQSQLKLKGLPWERAKAFDNSAVFSEFVDYQGDGHDISLQLFIDQQLIQQAEYELMIYKPVDIISEVSQFISFEDNDILMTGTPKGVGVVNKGARFTVKLFAQQQCLIEHSWTAL